MTTLKTAVYTQTLSSLVDHENCQFKYVYCIFNEIKESPSHVYTSAETYVVAMTVTDSDGSIDTLTRTDYITVTPGSGIAGCSKSPIKKGVLYHSTLQNAYDAANHGEVILMHKEYLSSFSLTLGRDLTITLRGGYNCDYTGRTGITTINGNITLLPVLLYSGISYCSNMVC